MISFLAKWLLHTIIFVPSVIIWALGGWFLAFLWGLMGTAYAKENGSGFLSTLFYPFVGYINAVFGTQIGLKTSIDYFSNH